MSSTPTPARGSDRAPTLRHALVQDVMRPGIVTCPPDADLISVARLMSGNHIHSVVVSGIESVPGGERLTWGLITALDLVACTQPGYEGAEAADLASTEIVTVEEDEPLERAAQLMVEHQLTHLVVVTAGEPVGMVSTLDVAGCLAWGEA
jgi:CBS domain-containing protein